MIDGFCGSSIATSLKLKLAEGSYALSEGEQVSPDLKNPKKANVNAAHSMI